MFGLNGVGRREFLAGAAALAGTSLLPRPSFAKPTESQLLEIARRELARAGRSVWLRDMVGLADFSMPSYEQRFFLVDMVGGKIKPYFVSHGSGSDPDHTGWLHRFSNEPGSLATSRGNYITHTWYEGQNGTSMRLAGIEHDNSNAEARAIVIHAADYAEPEMIQTWGKLGRSSGCFVFPHGNLMEILARLGPGRLLFADRFSATLPPAPPPQPVSAPPAQPVAQPSATPPALAYPEKL